MNDDPNRNVRYPLTWPAWLAEQVAESADARAMSVATWMREAAIEKLERTGKVFVTPSQVDAARMIIERNLAEGRETPEAIRKIAGVRFSDKTTGEPS